jgi:ketosteroid isomerase-like protein
MSDSSSVENDLRAIEAINQRDVQAALAGETDMMMSQWTDDFVVLAPVGPILRGRAVIAQAIAGMENPMETVDWALNFEEVKSLATTPCSGEPMVATYGHVQAATRSALAAS